jgi:hypothetical protein
MLPKTNTRCLSEDMRTELTHMRISHGEIKCVHENAHVIVV